MSPLRAADGGEQDRCNLPSAVGAKHYADLSCLAQMKRVAAEIAAAESRVDVLINNAGALFNTRHVTEDGLERTFAVNHVTSLKELLEQLAQDRAER